MVRYIIDFHLLVTIGSRHNRREGGGSFVINIRKEGRGEDIRNLSPLGINNGSTDRRRDGWFGNVGGSN